MSGSSLLTRQISEVFASEDDEFGIVVFMGYLMVLLEETFLQSPCRRQCRQFICISSMLNEEDFTRTYRLSRNSFYRLLSLLLGGIVFESVSCVHNTGTKVAADSRLAITLRMLAGASYLDLRLCFNVSVSSIYRIFHDTCQAIMEALRLPGISRSWEDLHRASIEFKLSRRFKNPLSGCVGALDGIAIKIAKPRCNERPAAYFCRKGYYAIPVQALVDANYRFLCYSARCVGATHDALAHSVSELGAYLSQGGLQEEFWICGDEAYECRNWLITPYARSQCNDKEKYFNFFLSSHRVHIEQAFGHLVARWRVLNGGLEFSLSRNIRVVCACMKLHNLCIEQGESFDSVRNELNSHGGTVEEVQAWYEEAKEHRQSSQSFSRTRSPARSIKRDKLRDLVWDLRKV